MSEMHPEFGKPMTEAEYAEEWEANATHFQKSGFYAMPLERLGAPKVVLEVGCGAGRSTLALAKKGHAVVALEINKVAAQKAHDYLKSNGIDVRLSATFPTNLPSHSCVTIVIEDVHSKAISRFDKSLKFDAIVCWFIGAHPAVIADAAGKDGPQLTTKDVQAYRISTQSKVYEIGRHLLSSGGVIQVVDRLALRSWQDKDNAREELAQMQRDVAGLGYDISKSSTYLERVSGEFEGSAIQYLSEYSGTAINVVTSVIGRWP